LGHYQRVADKDGIAQVVALLSGGDEPRLDKASLTIWLRCFAQARVVVDGELARVLITADPHNARYHDAYRALPELTDEGATVLCASEDWGLAYWALSNIDDAPQRLALSEAWLNQADLVAGEAVHVDGLAGLAEEPGMIEAITTLDDAAFARWALDIWYDPDSHLTDEFIARSLITLELDQFDAFIERLGDAGVVALASRAVNTGAAPGRDAIVVEVLTNYAKCLDDELRWQLLTIVPVNEILPLLPNGVNDDGAVRAGELGRLVAERGDCGEPLLRRLAGMGSVPWAQEAIDVLAVRWDDLGVGAWKCVNRQLAEAFGDDKTLWTIALGLLETWSSTIPELISTTRTLA
jgi:hypothetical protein